MFSQQKQKAFGWLVSFDLFFAAAGAGLFLVSFILNIMNKYEAVARQAGCEIVPSENEADAKRVFDLCTDLFVSQVWQKRKLSLRDAITVITHHDR